MTGTTFRHHFALLTVAWTALFLLVVPLSSQERQAPLSRISGTVLDSDILRPLAGATVFLESERMESVARAEDSSGPVSERIVVSDAAGSYRFENLPSGRYRLRFNMLGYKPETIGVDLRGSAESTLSVGLVVSPVALEPLAVEGTAASQSYGRPADLDEEIGGSRIAAARARQQAYLSTDVFGLTHSDVVESVTLGEPDLFRAFQRSPGVSARDDYGAELWVRGAAWGQTRVLFDGIPVLNPLHAFGLLSAVNTDAVGGALLHPGSQPANLAGGAAAVLEITSRAGQDRERLRGMADVSLASGRIGLDGGAKDGQLTWMIAARRSWVDLASAAASALADDRGMNLPFNFNDLTGRLDLRMSDERSLELSGFHAKDRVAGTMPDILHRTRADWGNTVGRATFDAPFRSLRTRTTVGFSRYEAKVREAPPDPEAEDRMSAGAAPPSDNGLSHVSLAGEVLPGSRESNSWRLGYALYHERSAYEGPHGFVYQHHPPVNSDSTLNRRGSITVGGLWGERDWELSSRVKLQTGLRLEAGPAVRNGGVLRLMPRFMGRYQPNDDFAISVGFGRTFQYTQMLVGTGPAITGAHAASQIWLIADDDAPAVRADVATVGAETWVGGEWLFGANAYLRYSTGVALGDATRGPLTDRPLFVVGENTARGFELSLRRLAGRWTAAGSYSLSRSDMDVAGERFPASEDRRHTIDASSMVRLGGSVRLGGAFSYASSAPYTRTYIQRETCSLGGCPYILFADEQNGRRSTATASLDLLLDWTTRFRSWEIGAYLQILNALDHENVSHIPAGAFTICPGSDPMQVDYSCRGKEYKDSFEDGLPRFPVIGFSARF